MQAFFSYQNSNLFAIMVCAVIKLPFLRCFIIADSSSAGVAELADATVLGAVSSE